MLNIVDKTDSVSVIAIEEPESHLHPESSRQLYETIQTLSLNHQVVLTTHSPLFVNRKNLNENIIVNSGKATPVKRVKEIRDVLGIKVSDNLTNAENVLIVEGEDDKITLEKILPNMSDIIKNLYKMAHCLLIILEEQEIYHISYLFIEIYNVSIMCFWIMMMLEEVLLMRQKDRGC